ncbi:MAG: hypothetical protein WD010_03905 [Nitriliruptor sp.]
MITLRHRPSGSALLGGALAVAIAGSLLAGCTEGGGDGSTALEPATGAALARDEPCAALDEADTLERRATAALADGAAPESVVDETIRVAAAVTVGLSCDDTDGDGAADDEVTDDEVTDDDRSGTPAPEPPPPAAEPAPAPAPAPAPVPPSGDDDGGSGSSGGDQGGGGGPENEPPGADRGGGPPPGRGSGQGGGP